jgi:hypothetical protein
MGFFVQQSIGNAVPSQSLSTERQYDLLGDIFTFNGQGPNDRQRTFHLKL